MISKSCCYFFVASEGFGGKGDGLLKEEMECPPMRGGRLEKLYDEVGDEQE